MLTAERLAVRDDWTPRGLATSRRTCCTRRHADLREELSCQSRWSCGGALHVDQAAPCRWHPTRRTGRACCRGPRPVPARPRKRSSSPSSSTSPLCGSQMLDKQGAAERAVRRGVFLVTRKGFRIDVCFPPSVPRSAWCGSRIRRMATAATMRAIVPRARGPVRNEPAHPLAETH